jgi:hypothetical protein
MRQEKRHPLQTFSWNQDFDRVGLAKDALYLIPPDTYVGLVNADQDIAAVEQFLARFAIQPRCSPDIGRPPPCRSGAAMGGKHKAALLPKGARRPAARQRRLRLAGRLALSAAR